MMYILDVRLRGVRFYIDFDTMENAYRTAKFVAAILGARTKQPTRKVWRIWNYVDCYYEYDVLRDSKKNVDMRMKIRSQMISYDYWGKRRSYVEKHA